METGYEFYLSIYAPIPILIRAKLSRHFVTCALFVPYPNSRKDEENVELKQIYQPLITYGST